MQRVIDQQRAYFKGVNNWLYFAWVMLSWVIIGLTTYWLDQKKRLGSAFGFALLAAFGLLGLMVSSVITASLALLLLALGLIGLIVAAVKRHDKVLQWAVVALLAYTAITLLIAWVVTPGIGHSYQ